MSEENVVVFKVEASRVSVTAGETVHPETPLGDDYISDEEVLAGVHGYVESIRFNGWDHSMEIVIRESDETDPEAEVALDEDDQLESADEADAEETEDDQDVDEGEELDVEGNDDDAEDDGDDSDDDDDEEDDDDDDQEPGEEGDEEVEDQA